MAAARTAPLPSAALTSGSLPLPPGERGSVRHALAHAAARFAFSATPRLDAELLMAYALDVTRPDLLLSQLDAPAPLAFAALADRRAAHEPVAYITGSRGFWTVELAVGPGVLIPRADTETLMEAAVAHFDGGPGPARALDLGTGSGALLLAALDQWPAATGVGIDASPAARAVAAANAERLGMTARAAIVDGGWAGTGEAFDLVLCNPPYVEDGADLPREVAAYEPASALFAGPDGLDDLSRLAPLLPRQIRPGGVVCVEIGAGQAAAAGDLFRAAGLAVSVARDLAGRDRCLVLTRPA